jgi:hypothetical protein
MNEFSSMASRPQVFISYNIRNTMTIIDDIYKRNVTADVL